MAAGPFARLLVIGAGLLGTSVALAVRRRWPDVELIAMDVVPRTHAPFDRHLDDTAAIPAYDLAVLACPLPGYADWLRRLAAHPAAPVTDIGSLKRGPAAAARRAGLTEFVGGHPMAGGTRPGPDHARATLFDGCPWYVVPGDASPAAVTTVRALAEGCGARVVEATAAAHDRAVGATSHLPQLVANLLMVTVGQAASDSALQASGPGLRDTTRLAESDVRMWLPIAVDNADVLAPLLDDFAARAAAAAATLRTNPSAIGDLFAAANAARRRLPPV